jgi:two-component system cell cycle response regulator
LNRQPREESRLLPLPNNRRRTDDAPEASPAPIRALIVDDDRHFLRYMELLVTRLGCRATVAADGESAWSELQARPFDLLLCDLEMPRLDGLELIRRLRTDELNGHILAVMLTNHDREEAKFSALTSGFDDFLPKSCTQIEVVSRIAAARRMLARQRALRVEADTWRSLALRDELTNVATRRAFFVKAERSLADGCEIGIALFDLDDFKQINDRFGHLAGDRILHDVGALFLSRVRSDDLIARYGGDEFVLLMSGVSVDNERSVLERLAEGVRSLRWTFESETVGVGITTGLGHSSLMERPTIEQLLTAADQELYTRKWLRQHPGSVPAFELHPVQAAPDPVPGAAAVPEEPPRERDQL